MSSRLLKHLLHLPLKTQRAFPTATRQAIGQAIARGEARHRGEIRFVVEGDWPLGEVWAKKPHRARALEVFGLSRAWDTAENTGILIYVLLCEHHIEILADRGINALVPARTWESICSQLRDDFAAGTFEAGSVRAVESVSAVLAAHFPASSHNPNELPDHPIIWR